MRSVGDVACFSSFFCSNSFVLPRVWTLAQVESGLFHTPPVGFQLRNWPEWNPKLHMIRANLPLELTEVRNRWKKELGICICQIFKGWYTYDVHENCLIFKTPHLPYPSTSKILQPPWPWTSNFKPIHTFPLQMITNQLKENISQDD